MSSHPTGRTSSPVRFLQKFVVSAFVVFSFLAYAVHEHNTNPDGAAAALERTPAAITQPLPSTSQVDPTSAATGTTARSAPNTAPPAAPNIVPPTAAPLPKPTAIARGQYRDGTYTGPSVDAFWGQVQVQAVVQNGRIASVRFLQYPNDRRTSVRINSFAVPTLQSEAVQVQNASVDIISGATLTSEAFVQSLQAALASARNA